MIHPETAASFDLFKFAETRAPAFKIKLEALGVHDADEIERVLTAFAAKGNGGVVVTPHAVTFSNHNLIVALAARLRLPALYPFAFYAKGGGLISYGFDPVNQFQQGAGYVDRILRGAKPADLPVQFPTAVEAIASPVRDRSELESVIAEQARAPNGGLVVMPDTFTDAHRVEITSLAARYRLPAVYPYRQFTAVGGLLSYGDDLIDNFRRAPTYVDRILKGEKPSELPVQAPVKFDLVINLKTAKALGLDVPVQLQQRADEVIE